MNIRKKLIVAFIVSLAFAAPLAFSAELDGKNITAKQATLLLSNYYQLDSALEKLGREVISESINNGISIEEYINKQCSDKEGTAKFECLGTSYYGVTKALKQ